MRAVFSHTGWTEDGTAAGEGHEWIRYRITRRSLLSLPNICRWRRGTKALRLPADSPGAICV
jgi:hypothetical protein